MITLKQKLPLMSNQKKENLLFTIAIVLVVLGLLWIFITIKTMTHVN